MKKDSRRKYESTLDLYHMFKTGRTNKVLYSFVVAKSSIAPEIWEKAFQTNGLSLVKMPTGALYLDLNPQARVFLIMFAKWRFQYGRTIASRVTAYKRIGKVPIYKTMSNGSPMYWFFDSYGAYTQVRDYAEIEYLINQMELRTKYAEKTMSVKLTLLDYETLITKLRPLTSFTTLTVREQYLLGKLEKNRDSLIDKANQ